MEARPLSPRPALVRGDSAFGNEGVMAALATLEPLYLCKLRQTAGVKRLIERQWARHDGWTVAQGVDAVEATLRLSGWSRARRVVVRRRRLHGRILAETRPPEGQQTLLFAGADDPVKWWEYTVLVTNAA